MENVNAYRILDWMKKCTAGGSVNVDDGWEDKQVPISSVEQTDVAIYLRPVGNYSLSVADLYGILCPPSSSMDELKSFGRSLRRSFSSRYVPLNKKNRLVYYQGYGGEISPVSGFSIVGASIVFHIVPSNYSKEYAEKYAEDFLRSSNG